MIVKRREKQTAGQIVHGKRVNLPWQLQYEEQCKESSNKIAGKNDTASSLWGVRLLLQAPQQPPQLPHPNVVPARAAEMGAFTCCVQVKQSYGFIPGREVVNARRPHERLCDVVAPPAALHVRIFAPQAAIVEQEHVLQQTPITPASLQ
jgi:hypothetical protein